MSDELDALKLLAAQDKQILEVQRRLKAIPLQLDEARKQLDSEQLVLNEVKIPHDSHVRDIQEKESSPRSAPVAPEAHTAPRPMPDAE